MDRNVLRRVMPPETYRRCVDQADAVVVPIEYRHERDLVRDVLAYLDTRGIFAWRNNTGGIRAEYGEKKRFFRFGAPGSGDVFGVLAGGRFLSIECKVRGNKPTLAQDEWIGRVRQAGGVAGVVHDLQELGQLLKGA